MGNKRNLKSWLIISVFLVAIGCTSNSGATIYVDASATGANDGSSWADAYKYLQDALAAASSGDKIWVAQGTYKPDHGGGQTPGDRMAVFQLINGVALYGGFAGTETSLDDRDWQTNETILSGDLNGDDGPDFANYGENSYHIIVGWPPFGGSIDATTILDGFTITAGNSVGTGIGGSGMYNLHSSPTVTNCTFSGNLAHRPGGGMYNTTDSNPTLTNCTFSGNLVVFEFGGISMSHGGGMYNGASSPTLTNCTFSGNSARWGAGMANAGGRPRLINCTFRDNFADVSGGAMQNSGSPTMITSPTVINCTFSGNSATTYGGGMYNSHSSPTVTNCILWGDSAPSGPEIYNISSTPIVTYSDIAGGYSGPGNIDADPMFADTDKRLSARSPCIDAGNNTIVPPDTTDLDGDGDTAEPIPFDLDGNPRIINGIVDMGAYESPFGPEPPSGLVSKWPGDGNANDIEGENHGALMNGATFASGKVNQAFSFDGVDDYVEIQYDASFNLSSFTLQAWVKFTQSDTLACIISRPNDGNSTDGYSFFKLINAWSRIAGGVQGEGQYYSSSVSTGSTTFADNNWHMCSFVRNVQANEISIYVDSVLYMSYPDSSPGDMEHNYKGITIGSYEGSRDFFEGLIDEVTIYNRALTADEIRAIFLAASAGE